VSFANKVLQVEVFGEEAKDDQNGMHKRLEKQFKHISSMYRSLKDAFQYFFRVHPAAF